MTITLHKWASVKQGLHYFNTGFAFDHVFFFVKARYQNAEEVLKQR